MTPDPEVRYVLVDSRKLEVMKVWYALFTTLMDTSEYTDQRRMLKLRQLRELLRREAPELEVN